MVDIDRKRHLAKAITWRVLGSLTTILVAWAVTGQWKIGAMVGGVETIGKIVLYYLHERIWFKVKWGVKHQ